MYSVHYLAQRHTFHQQTLPFFLNRYGLAGPPSPMYDYGYGPVQQGRPPMPLPFGPQTPGFWQQPQFGPAPPLQQPEASIQVYSILNLLFYKLSAKHLSAG